MPTIVVKVSEALDEKLAREARRSRRTKSALVLGILKSAFSANGQIKGEITAFEAGQGVWGSVEGPGDLSHNPRHLDGYGKK